MNAQVLLAVMVGSVRIKSMDSFVPVLMGLQTTLARQVRAVKINIELRPNFIKQKHENLLSTDKSWLTETVFSCLTA